MLKNIDKKFFEQNETMVFHNHTNKHIKSRKTLVSHYEQCKYKYEEKMSKIKMGT